jgi:hypothetical protein
VTLSIKYLQVQPWVAERYGSPIRGQKEERLVGWRRRPWLFLIPRGTLRLSRAMESLYTGKRPVTLLRSPERSYPNNWWNPEPRHELTITRLDPVNLLL